MPVSASDGAAVRPGSGAPRSRAITPAPVLSVVGGPEFIAGIAGATLGGDFGSMFKSTAYGTDITAPVWAIDLVLPPGPVPNTSTSGCEAADYAGVPAGAIILVQRGTCTFAQKFALADASRAGAMVFINEGQPGRTEPLWFNFDGLDIPTFAATVDTVATLSNGVLSGKGNFNVKKTGPPAPMEISIGS